MIEPEILATTRRSLHGAAELLLAGPQHRRSGTIRLRVVPGGFATVAAPDLAVLGCDVVSGDRRLPLDGRPLRAVAEALGIRPGAPEDLYADGSGVGPDEVLVVDASASEHLMTAFAAGDAALRAFAPGATPVLWPEHFDLATELGATHVVNAMDVSPEQADELHDEPYLYVVPW